MKTVLSILAMSCLLVACGNDVAQSTPETPSAQASQAVGTSSVSEVNNNNVAWKTYMVGSQLTYPPFHYQDEKGNPIGFEMELLQAVARAGEFNISVMNAPRNTLEQTLADGTVQIWSSTVSISPERLETMDFSQPFMTRDYDAIYMLDDEAHKNIQTLEHLKGKKIAINEFSKSAPETVATLTGSADNAVITKSYHLSMKELFAGNVDAVLDNGLVLANYVAHQPEAPKLRSITVSDSPKNFAFAVKKGNNEVLEKLNKGLAAVKADGTYERLVKKWFGNETI